MNEIAYKVEDIKSNLNFAKCIKSEYILKEIFSFLGRKKLLNLIIYNKHLQNVLKINKEDYKKLSRKYKICGRDGKVKIYKLNTMFLIFEGEYLKGEKNGKGKEYNKYGELEFEGEYLNGKRWNGKEREYYETGQLKFEGEYLKGEKIIKGKEYNKYGELEYKGEYLNGKRNGKGKEYYDNGKLEFEGEYLNGKRWNGKGYNINGINEFQIYNGKGKGKEYNKYGKLKYEGEYLNGERNGKGKEYYDYISELEFEGIYLNGKRWNGKIYNINKSI